VGNIGHLDRCIWVLDVLATSYAPKAWCEWLGSCVWYAWWRRSKVGHKGCSLVMICHDAGGSISGNRLSNVTVSHSMARAFLWDFNIF
jgi:hypothetical protein